MTTNPYFENFKCDNEQDLYEDLVIESIQMYGHDVIYLPRTLIKEDLLYEEDVLSQFSDSLSVEVYIKNVTGWSGQGDLLSKLGLEIRDQMSLVVSIRRFREELIKRDLFENLGRPREGDLIYFPLSKDLFEINFVEHEGVFYQNGKLKIYELNCEKFEFTHEDLITGIPEVDIIEDNYTYSILLNLGAGSGTYLVGENIYQGASLSTATAKAKVISYDSGSNIIKIKEVAGAFNLTDSVIGNSSAASYIITTVNTQDNVNDTLGDNVEIQLEADAVIDFSEGNPFGDKEY